MRLRAIVAVVAGVGVAGVGVAGVGVAVAVTSTASASSPVVVDRENPTAGGVLIPTHAGQALPRHGGTVDSLNWSGYAVTPSSNDITAVTSTFEAPEAGAVPPGFAATWTGIGGYSTTDLIQAGVSENSLPDNPIGGDQYSAWYELLPASETNLTDCTGNSSCPVAPGDTVTVHIEQVGSGTWSIAVANPTEGWTWSKTVSYSSSQSSAEWILEAPTVITQTPLADVGTAHFGPTSTYTAGGTTITAAQGDPTEIVLSPGVVNEATPSSIASDGQSFNDCAYAQTCAAP